MQHFFALSDVLLEDGEWLVVVLRDHKTDRSAGLYRFVVHEPVREMFKYWLNTGRPLILGDRAGHDNVFLNPNTGKKYDQQGFSKFMGQAFLNVTGHELNLQIARRIFSTGMPTEM